ncbi:hypothetical protein JL09_g4855 [Pichia kudriavzevii]|uniref:60S ribosomal protein L34-B n=1 Tax=Pichia kudriavzevii TaxID=4909 RepID=A0A099NVR7_PICKU|nr:hypothetical protein JL09_g4855 [Pichia kudriavzevii]
MAQRVTFRRRNPCMYKTRGDNSHSELFGFVRNEENQGTKDKRQDSRYTKLLDESITYNARQEEEEEEEKLKEIQDIQTEILTFPSDNTKSNQIKVVKTPGGKLVAQHVKKQATRPKCGDCGIPLPGIATLRPRGYASISKTQKTVSRAYGGSRCANCVKERVVRAFLIEEQKVVKKVLKEAAAKK